MNKKNKLASLALTGLLLASSFPTDTHATNPLSTSTLLAVAECGAHGCEVKKNTPPVSESRPSSTIQNQVHATPGHDNQINSSVANAGGDYAIPHRGGRSSSSGYSTPSTTTSSIGGNYGSRFNTYSDINNGTRGSSVGGSYSVPENRYGGSSEAGSWGGTNRPNIGTDRVRDYNYSEYNTNRNFETSPNYQGDYIDSSFYSDTVAPYGAPRTEGFDKQYNRDIGHGYEAITTSGIVTQEQLQSLVSAEAWNVYLQLDSEGKALALQYASQANFPNKDLAIREAYIRMQSRRAVLQKLQ